jgi:hypothetical protein
LNPGMKTGKVNLNLDAERRGKSSVVTKWLASLLRVREVPGSNLVDWLS